jgi:hypothetical protein
MEVNEETKRKRKGGNRESGSKGGGRSSEWGR